MSWAWPARPRFPSAARADADGLVRIGGQLTVDWLLDAYGHGIFPWPIVDGRRELLAWFSPDPRAILELDDLYVSKRLARRVRSGEYSWTCDSQFEQVMLRCAERGSVGTWITPAMQAAYVELHRRGYAHSVETWHAGMLVGGIYGVALGGYFAAESMFYHRRDASKIALYWLVQQLRAGGFRLLDVQVASPHLLRLGVREIPRREFLARLEQARHLPAHFAAR